ncbi:MAG: hypothetical protein GXY14_14565 [Spirochaetes bacterium]|nr:hypothetical protein [Spirochaetota bacterium]
MAIRSFDHYFMNLPGMDAEPDFDRFWDKSVTEIRKIPIEPEVHENTKKTTAKFKVYDISYNGFLKARIKGLLYAPKKKSKVRFIVHLHDYNRFIDKSIIRHLNENVAHLFLIIRGHEIVENRLPEEERPLGYIIENIIDLDTYYARSVYLDVYRSIDFLRLISFADCNKVGISGKGFGAAAGFFTAVTSNRVGAIVMDSPLFCNLPLSQNISQSDASREINDIINIQKSRKHQIKKNLSYFDINNFADRLKCPAMFVSGLNDTIAPPECVLGVFNRLQCEKVIEVYPDDGNDAGGEKQRIKAMDWLAKIILTD